MPPAAGFCIDRPAHAARLKSGEQVIVKVRRPRVIQLIEQDLEILNGMAELAKVYTHLGRAYNLPALVEEFAYTLRNELDYQREAQNAVLFQDNFRDEPTIYIPSIFPELSTSQVLTIERVEGVKVGHHAEGYRGLVETLYPFAGMAWNGTWITYSGGTLVNRSRI